MALFFPPQQDYIGYMNRRALISAALALPLAGLFSPAFGQDGRDLARISAYLNSIGDMTGDFVQIDPDGLLSEGLFYMSRPGRIRFEYNDPNPALVISDGFWVAVIDKRYDQIERYPLSETPLNLILRENVNLGRDSAVEGIQRADGQMRVSIRDPEHPDRGSLTLIFGNNPLELRQWIVRDSQGGDTTVALSSVRRNVEMKNSYFVIPDKGAGANKIDR